MNSIKNKLLISIFPVLVVFWGIFMLTIFDPFYSKSSDPEFPYLVNGLNCAQLKFNYIGHIDHPGTPFQVYNGIIIRMTHLVSGKAGIVQDVFTRPEHYLNAIAMSLFLLQALLIFWIGLLGIRRDIPFWQIAFLQAGFLFNEVILWLFCRVNPDFFFMVTGLIFFLIYLKHGYENRSPMKFALWSGTVMALGLATKFNFLPLLFLPLLFIDTNKNRLIYAGSGIISFFIFILPIIDKFKEYRKFVMSIFQHDGLYGTGESKVLNFRKMIESTKEIFSLNPELLVIVVALIVMIVIAIRKRNEGYKKYIFWFAGFLFIIAIQIIMVSKHFKNYYLAPTFMMYGFMFFISSGFISGIVKKKSAVILMSNILPVLFVLITIGKSKLDYHNISTQIDQREKIRNFVDTQISKDDFWFVEPTWESGPYAENALVYGLSYCGHRDQYASQLRSINPNIITYEGNPNEVKLWRCAPASLDSVVATKKNIYLYSTPGRNANVLVQMLQHSAEQKGLQLLVETFFSDPDTKNDILRAKAIDPDPNSPTRIQFNEERQKKIEGYIQSIKSTPEWLEKVKQKAILKNISLDSMILLDAIYMVETEK